MKHNVKSTKEDLHLLLDRYCTNFKKMKSLMHVTMARYAEMKADSLKKYEIAE